MSILSPYSVIWVLAVTWKIFLKQNCNPYTLSNWCSATHYLSTYQTILKKKKKPEKPKTLLMDLFWPFTLQEGLIPKLIVLLYKINPQDFLLINNCEMIEL